MIDLKAGWHSEHPWAEIRRTGAHKPVLRCCYLRVLCWQVQWKPKQTPHCSSRGSAVFSTAIEVTLRLSALSCHWQPVRFNYRKNSLTTNIWATVIFSFGLITHFSVHIHILKYISNENVVISHIFKTGKRLGDLKLLQDPLHRK